MEQWDAILDEENRIVSITVDEETRQFKVFSKRAGQCLELLVKQLEEGITSVDMKRDYDIDDNKLFSELKHESGFEPFMSKDFPRRESKNVWKIDLSLLWKSVKGLESPIWFGSSEQTDLQKFAPALKKRDGYVCNISGIPLLDDVKRKFVSNLRRPAIDHRRPKIKNGKDELENLQFLAEYINEMKNQQCAPCIEAKCEECALAFPEKTSIIFPTKEDISFFAGVKKKK